MNREMYEPRDGRLALGLVIGVCAGAGLALWLAPRLRAEFRERVTDAATSVRVRVGEVADDLVRRGQHARDEMAEAVARGAHEVERHATGVQTDPAAAAKR